MTPCLGTGPNSHPLPQGGLSRGFSGQGRGDRVEGRPTAPPRWGKLPVRSGEARRRTSLLAPERDVVASPLGRRGGVRWGEVRVRALASLRAGAQRTGRGWRGSWCGVGPEGAPAWRSGQERAGDDRRRSFARAPGVMGGAGVGPGRRAVRGVGRGSCGVPREG